VLGLWAGVALTGAPVAIAAAVRAPPGG
jgi:hypothetical protein